LGKFQQPQSYLVIEIVSFKLSFIQTGAQVEPSGQIRRVSFRFA